MDNNTEYVSKVSGDTPCHPGLPLSKSIFDLRQKLCSLIDAHVNKKSVLPDADKLLHMMDRHERILNRTIDKAPEVFSG